MTKQVREIRIVFLIFTVIFTVVGYKYYNHPASYFFFAVASLLLITLAVAPLALKPLFECWLKLALIIGKINTAILLVLFFILAFIPMGVFMRLLGKDPLKKSFSDQESYWDNYESSGLKDPKRYEKQF